VTPEEAYVIVEKEGPSDKTREDVLSSPTWSYWYARDVDKSPRDDTRQAVLSSNGPIGMQRLLTSLREMIHVRQY